MCLSANEPGGPRRCGNYRRRIEKYLDQLRVATYEHQKLVKEREAEERKWIATYSEAFDKAKREDLPESEMPSQDFIKQGLAEQDRIIAIAEREGDAAGRENVIRSKLTALMTIHQEESERFGSVVENSTDPNFDPDGPYLILSPLNHKRVTDVIESGVYGQGHKVFTRKRLIPLTQPDGSEHPYLSVGVVDVQFSDQSLIDAFEQAEMASDYGHSDPKKWQIDVRTLLSATLQQTRGGRDYQSGKETPDGQESTAEKIKKLVFSNTPASINPSGRDLDSLIWFAKKYPGSSTYSAKVREIANKGYVSAKDAPILISSVSGWRKYVDQKEAQAQRLAEKARSQHLGVVGAKITTGVLTIQRAKVNESKFGGFYTSFTAVDEEGNVIRWNDGNAPEFEEGDTITFTSEVREHGEYQGVKQTMMKAPDKYHRMVPTSLRLSGHL